MIKNSKLKKKPIKGFKNKETIKVSTSWHKSLYGLRRCLLGVVIALTLVPACGTPKEIPTNTSTEVHVKDSTIFHIKDSIRVIERSRYKDYTSLLDTLSITSETASLKAWCDTSRNVIAAELETKPIEEKTRIIYKDRLVYRDSLVFRDVPVEIIKEKEKKVYPRWLVLLSILGITLTCLEGFRIYGKLKKKFPLG